MILTVVGSGTLVPSARRSTPALLLQEGEQTRLGLGGVESGVHEALIQLPAATLQALQLLLDACASLTRPFAHLRTGEWAFLVEEL